MRLYKAKDFGYLGTEILMNPYSDTVGTSEEWASEAHLWLNDYCEPCDDEEVGIQFGSLIEVVPDGTGYWKEV